MKHLLILAAFAAMPLFADEPLAPTTADTAAAAAPAAAAEKTATAAEHKLTRKEAKVECTKEGKKGKDLQACVKEKMGKH